MYKQAARLWWRRLVSATMQLPGALSTDIAVHGNCQLMPICSALGLMFAIDVVLVKELLGHCLIHVVRIVARC